MIDLQEFTKVCTLQELSEQYGKRFIIDDVEVAVFKVDNKIHAVSNICPHQHTALIYDGFIEDGCVVCPVHGWKFNLETGMIPSRTGKIDVYPVEVQNNNVYIKVSKKELKW